MEQEKFIKNNGGMIFNSFLFFLNILCLISGLAQLCIVSLVPYKERNIYLQTLFIVALVPVPENDYMGKDQMILVLCLMAHVFSCVCVTYVIGSAIFDPKYTAKNPKFMVSTSYTYLYYYSSFRNFGLYLLPWD